MSLNSKQFHFLEESNRNINFKELNTIILNNSLNESALSGVNTGVGKLTTGTKNLFKALTGGKLGAAGKGLINIILGNDEAYRAYLANEKAQGPLGRLGGEYREAGMKAFLAPYRMAPQALEGSVAANLSRTGRTSKSSLIQYGPVKF
jgi:hypothetical protein